MSDAIRQHLANRLARVVLHSAPAAVKDGRTTDERRALAALAAEAIHDIWARMAEALPAGEQTDEGAPAPKKKGRGKAKSSE